MKQYIHVNLTAWWGKGSERRKGNAIILNLRQPYLQFTSVDKYILLKTEKNILRWDAEALATV